LSSSILIISAITLCAALLGRVYAEVPFFHAASISSLSREMEPGPFHPYVLCFPARLVHAYCASCVSKFRSAPLLSSQLPLSRTATKTFFGPKYLTRSTTALFQCDLNIASLFSVCRYEYPFVACRTREGETRCVQCRRKRANVSTIRNRQNTQGGSLCSFVCTSGKRSSFESIVETGFLRRYSNY